MCCAQAFLERTDSLISASKDGYVRAWDLKTQHCFQTLGGQQGEVNTFHHVPPLYPKCKPSRVSWRCYLKHRRVFDLGEAVMQTEFCSSLEDSNDLEH